MRFGWLRSLQYCADNRCGVSVQVVKMMLDAAVASTDDGSSTASCQDRVEARPCRDITGTPCALFSSEDDSWFTPSDIVERVRSVFGGVIDLDPCSCLAANQVVAATSFYDKSQDGLSVSNPWHAW
jgi:hypothetical protein